MNIKHTISYSLAVANTALLISTGLKETYPSIDVDIDVVDQQGLMTIEFDVGSNPASYPPAMEIVGIVKQLEADMSVAADFFDIETEMATLIEETFTSQSNPLKALAPDDLARVKSLATSPSIAEPNDMDAWAWFRDLTFDTMSDLDSADADFLITIFKSLRA